MLHQQRGTLYGTNSTNEGIRCTRCAAVQVSCSDIYNCYILQYCQ